MIWLISMMVDNHDARVVAAFEQKFPTEQRCEAAASDVKRKWLLENPAAAKRGYTVVTVCTTLEQPKP